jgi:hypothetical protein
LTRTRYKTVQFPAQMIDEVRRLLKPFGFRSISEFCIASVRDKVIELTKVLSQKKSLFKDYRDNQEVE